MAKHLLQHGDNVDFAQDVLSAIGGNPELNPISNGVLAGFARRQRFGRFKCGQLSLDFDRLRYANTITPNDSNLAAKEVSRTKKKPDGTRSCDFFQRPVGCSYGVSCRFLHWYVVCGSPSHDASTCRIGDVSNGENRERERPPHPRFRRERAQ